MVAVGTPRGRTMWVVKAVVEVGGGGREGLCRGDAPD